ncbi:MAG: hypothetical protein DELT_00692 [Desulfovibrio sp.]
MSTATLGTCFCKEWGWVALRGVIAIALGVMAVVWPFATIWALAILWGVFALIDGVSAGITSWHLHKQGIRWWPYALFAVTGVIAGIAALLWPGITAMVLLVVIAVWAVIGGISQIIAAIRLRKELQGEGFLIFAGAISLLFGVLLLWRPVEGLIAIAWIISFYAFLTGGITLMLAYNLRKRCAA